jgi:hypothetical protein
VTLSEARQELAARGFDYVSGGRMTIMLNNARNAFEDAWPFPWLWKEITGPPPLTIADLKLVMMVKNAATHEELLGLDVRQAAQDGTDLNEGGLPAYWYVEGPDPDAILRTWPVGTAPLDVLYIAESPELANDLDEPLIPKRYQPVWLDLAVIQAYKDSDNFSAAQALSADVNGRLLQIIERYETRNRQHSPFISVRPPFALDE